MSYKRITDPDAATPDRPRELREANKGIGTGNAPGSRWRKRGDRGPNKVDRVLKRDCTLRALSMEGILPLEYMLSVMRDENATTDRRDDMAKAAAPFIHPKLQSQAVQISGPEGKPIEINDAARRVAFLLTSAAAAASVTDDQTTES